MMVAGKLAPRAGKAQRIVIQRLPVKLQEGSNWNVGRSAN